MRSPLRHLAATNDSAGSTGTPIDERCRVSPHRRAECRRSHGRRSQRLDRSTGLLSSLFVADWATGGNPRRRLPHPPQLRLRQRLVYPRLVSHRRGLLRARRQRRGCGRLHRRRQGDRVRELRVPRLRRRRAARRRPLLEVWASRLFARRRAGQGEARPTPRHRARPHRRPGAEPPPLRAADLPDEPGGQRRHPTRSAAASNARPVPATGRSRRPSIRRRWGGATPPT